MGRAVVHRNSILDETESRRWLAPSGMMLANKSLTIKKKKKEIFIDVWSKVGIIVRKKMNARADGNFDRWFLVLPCSIHLFFSQKSIPLLFCRIIPSFLSKEKKKNSLCFLLLLILLVTKCGFRNLRFDDLLECLAELREILTYNLLVYYNRYYKGYRWTTRW